MPISGSQPAVALTQGNIWKYPDMFLIVTTGWGEGRGGCKGHLLGTSKACSCSFTMHRPTSPKHMIVYLKVSIMLRLKNPDSNQQTL